MSTCGNPGCTFAYGHVGPCGQWGQQKASADWWEYGPQANAAANVCAANQGAQARLNHMPGSACVGADQRIAELEAENAKLREAVTAMRGTGAPIVDIADLRRRETARANALADECGRLRDENTQLLAENARLRRGKR